MKYVKMIQHFFRKIVFRQKRGFYRKIDQSVYNDFTNQSLFKITIIHYFHLYLQYILYK